MCCHPVGETYSPGSRVFGLANEVDSYMHARRRAVPKTVPANAWDGAT